MNTEFATPFQPPLYLLTILSYGVHGNLEDGEMKPSNLTPNH